MLQHTVRAELKSMFHSVWHQLQHKFIRQTDKGFNDDFWELNFVLVASTKKLQKTINLHFNVALISEYSKAPCLFVLRTRISPFFGSWVENYLIQLYQPAF